MAYTVLVPPGLNAHSMHRLVDGAIQDGRSVSAEIVLDFSRVRFIESVGVVILSNAVEWLRHNGATVQFVNATRDNAAVAYLDDIGFFEAYWNKPLSPYAKLRDTTFPFRALQCADSHQWVDGNIFPWLKSKLKCPDNALYEMKTAIREVFNNIADHSEENVGCMHIQWHPNIEIVKIAISDFGIGIPAEVRKVLPDATDQEALDWATYEGNSSKKGPDSRNMGVGLSYLIDNITKTHKGWIGLYSGRAGCTVNHLQNKRNLHTLSGVYPGTLINMILRAGTLPKGPEERDDFEW